MTEQPKATAVAAEAVPPERRGFLAGLAAIVTGGLITLAPVVSGGLFSIDPLRRQRTRFLGADADGFLPGPKFSDLPADGTPVRFTIKADIIDAWNLFKDRTLGTVWLRNVAGNVIAFNDICPHLGCKVGYQSSTKSFYCPCHASAFGLDGKKTNVTPPRDMDELKVKVQDGKIWVKYQDFKGGIHEQKAIG